MSRIYAKTEAGRWAAYNTQSALPRKIRSLLLMINGHSDESLYIKSLETYGDVPTLLESLRLAGLIEIVGEASPEPTAAEQVLTLREKLERPQAAARPARPAPVALNAHEQGEAALLQELSAFSNFSSTQPMKAWSATSIIGNDSILQNDFSAPTMVLAEPGAGVDADVQRARSLMAQFIQAHFGNDAPQYLPQLDDIRTKEDLYVVLGGYSLLVESRAPAHAAAHTAELRGMLNASALV